MGSACCVAAKSRDVSQGTSRGGHRNVTCSPSWSFRWENRRRVADEVADSPYHVSGEDNRNLSVEIKTSLGSGRRTFSDGGSPFDNAGTPISQKSPFHEEMVLDGLISLPSDLSFTSNSREVKRSSESPNIAYSTVAKPSFQKTSLPTLGSDFATHAPPLPPKSTPSRRARRSPGHQLFRQVSDSKILGLKSPDHYPLSEGRSSFVLSSCSNDFGIGSLGGSSDGWSLQAFSELVASSQRERWSFDSEHLGSATHKDGSIARFSCSSSEENQTCGACSRPLKERSSWGSNELPVVAVLVCGHVYHAECLEVMTLESERYDPACPVCTVGPKRVAKMSRRALKAEAELKAKLYKRSRNRVVNGFLDGSCDDFIQPKNASREGKALKMDTSSLRSTLAKPFLKRHFSLGSKSSKPLAKDSPPKKGFWSRHRSD